MSKPRVSAIMSAFNTEAYIGRAIESVAEQTFRDWELIVIDGSPNDKTRRIVEQWSRREPRVRLIVRPGQTIPQARNEAIAVARGEYLAVVDSDDILPLYRFEEEVKFLDRCPNHVIVSGHLQLIDPDGNPICVWTAPLDENGINDLLMSGSCMGVPHVASMMRTAPVREVGGYREKFHAAEDLDLFLRLSEKGRLGNIDKIMTEYRQHLGSICHREPWRVAEVAWQAVQEARQRRDLPAEPKAPVAPREPQTAETVHANWSWWALAAGNRSVARRHAWRAVRASPTSGKSWKLLMCALRGH